VGPREGPVSAPAWPLVRTRVDVQQSDGLIADGILLLAKLYD